MRDRDRGQGPVVIGGDRGDVHAKGATTYEDGVVLHDVRLRTSMPGLGPAAVTETIQEIVLWCYESIGEDTFSPRKARY